MPRKTDAELLEEVRQERDSLANENWDLQATVDRMTEAIAKAKNLEDLKRKFPRW